MDVLDFFALSKRYFIFVVGLPVLICGACVLAVTLMPDTYLASASFNISGQAASISSLADNVVGEFGDETTKCTASTNVYTRVVNVSVRGVDADQCVTILQAASRDLQEKISEAHPEVKVVPHISDKAQVAKPSRARYGLSGLMAGLVLSVIVILLEGVVKRPIVGKRTIEFGCSLPVLGTVPANDGLRLMAINVALRISKTTKVFLVPAGPRTTASIDEILVESISKTLGTLVPHETPSHDGPGHEGQLHPKHIHSITDSLGLDSESMFVPEILATRAVQEDPARLLSMRGASAVIFARRWEESMDNILFCARELSLSDMDVLGVVVCDGPQEKARLFPTILSSFRRAARSSV